MFGCCVAASGCTLRAAIEEANSDSSSDVIELPLGIYALEFGRLNISSDLTIDGQGSAVTYIDGLNRSRIFEIRRSGNVTIRDLTIRNGDSPSGGGIRVNGGMASLIDVVVEDNTAESGAGISVLWRWMSYRRTFIDISCFVMPRQVSARRR